MCTCSYSRSWPDSGGRELISALSAKFLCKIVWVCPLTGQPIFVCRSCAIPCRKGEDLSSPAVYDTYTEKLLWPQGHGGMFALPSRGSYTTPKRIEALDLVYTMRQLSDSCVGWNHQMGLLISSHSAQSQQTGDNAAMIAFAAFFDTSGLALDEFNIDPSLTLAPH